MGMIGAFSLPRHRHTMRLRPKCFGHLGSHLNSLVSRCLGPPLVVAGSLLAAGFRGEGLTPCRAGACRR